MKAKVCFLFALLVVTSSLPASQVCKLSPPENTLTVYGQTIALDESDQFFVEPPQIINPSMTLLFDGTWLGYDLDPSWVEARRLQYLRSEKPVEAADPVAGGTMPVRDWEGMMQHSFWSSEVANIFVRWGDSKWQTYGKWTSFIKKNKSGNKTKDEILAGIAFNAKMDYLSSLLSLAYRSRELPETNTVFFTEIRAREKAAKVAAERFKMAKKVLGKYVPSELRALKGTECLER